MHATHTVHAVPDFAYRCGTFAGRFLAQGYLVKPAENEQLVAEVNRLIADAKLTHQNEIRIAIQL